MRKAVVYFSPGNARSKLVAQALYAGIRPRDGVEVEMLSSLSYKRPEHDVALFYGFADGLRTVFEEYRASGRKAVYVDLGFFKRRKKTRWDGYHKITVNDRHPTSYFQNARHPGDRLAQLALTIKPWRKDGRHVLVIGMSGKGAVAEGFQPHMWERDAINRLRALTKRPVIYRPKPNWIGARPLPGSIYQNGASLEESLHDCHAVVCYHSNVAVEAIVAGIPAFVKNGVATRMGLSDLSQIDSPIYPDGRAQWLADIAYCQWTLHEMERGLAWDHLIREGLI